MMQITSYIITEIGTGYPFCTLTELIRSQ